MSLLYRVVESREEWTRLTTERVLDGWYHDVDCTEAASRREADAASDDIYTEGGWNAEPPRYPALVHIELDATNGSRLDPEPEGNYLRAYITEDCLRPGKWGVFDSPAYGQIAVGLSREEAEDARDSFNRQRAAGIGRNRAIATVQGRLSTISGA